MLVAIAYSGKWQQLYLKFRAGDVYCYRGVPSGRYQELLAADSKAHMLGRTFCTATRISEFMLPMARRASLNPVRSMGKDSVGGFDSNEQDVPAKVFAGGCRPSTGKCFSSI